MDVKGKVALVTGAGVRVGRAIAMALAERGMDLAVHYNSSATDAEQTVREARSLGVTAESFKADLSRIEEIAPLIEAVDETWGRLDVLVNSAAIFPRTPWDEIDEAVWDRAMTVNLKAPFFTSWHAARLMKRGGSGKIVNVADWAGLRPYRHYLPYLASKGGVITMTKAMAKELAPEITVNAVAPGPVLLPDDFDEEAAQRIADETLVQRLGSPEDIAQSVCYLVAMTDFVTGHILVVDGGRLIA